MTSVRTFRFPRIDRVVHGPGAIGEVPALVDELGATRVLILTGSTLAFMGQATRKTFSGSGACSA